MSQIQNIHIPLGYALTLVTDAFSSGTYVRQTPGGTRYTPSSLGASTTVVIGPFNEPRDYIIDVDGNFPTNSLAVSGVYTAVDEAANAAIVGTATAFTPVLDGAVTGAGTYSTQTGVYQTCGKVVNFAIAIVWTAHAATGAAKITGLPVASRTGIKQVITLQPVSVAGATSPAYLEIGSAATQGSLFYVNGSTRTAIDIEAAGEFYATGCYFTD